MNTIHKPTPAEKRKATLAAKAAQELEENIAFINKSRKAGGRQAKKDAKTNAIWRAEKPNTQWTDDQPATRKRTSSTAEVSGPAKKARETNPSGSDGETGDQAPAQPVVSKAKDKAPVVAKGKKHAAPNIDIDTGDESQSEAIVPVKIKTTVGKTVTASKTKVSEAGKGKADGHKVSKPAKIIAESASEDDTSSSNGDDEDSEDGSDGDEPVDAEKFRSEVPRVVSTRSKVVDDASDSDSHELDDVAPRVHKAVKKTSHPKLRKDIPQTLFESDSDEYEVVVDPKKSSRKSKAPPVTMIKSDSEDSMPDAPKIRSRIPDGDVEMAEVPARHRSRRSSMASSGHESMPDAPKPRRHILDSDIEFAEAMADAVVSIPRSRRSSMASSYSSGNDLSVPASEMGSDSDKSEPENTKKGKKVSAARQKQADSEKPVVLPAAASNVAADKGKAPVDASNRPESSWDVSTQLVLPAPNKDIGLTAQHPELQFVLRASITKIKQQLLFLNAYPTFTTRAGFARPYLIEAARLRPSSSHILERLLTDSHFAAILAPIPIDRVNIVRGDFKRCAVSCILAFFGLAGLEPAKVKERVEEQLKDHRYIFPTDPKTGQLQLNKPFHSGAIRYVLKEELFSNSSFLTQNAEHFPATNSRKPQERELADAMVSLAATAIYAALLEFRMTGQRQTIAFTEDAYEDTFRNHMDTLEQLHATAPNSTHRLMHELFNDVTAVNATVHTASGSSSTLIQVVDIPDSD